MSTSTTPQTKPQPVVIYGGILAALTTLVGGLTALFADNPTAVTVLAVCALVLTAAGVLKDQVLKGLVVPVADTASYLNDDRELVAGPASDTVEGTVVEQPVAAVTPGDPAPPVSDYVGRGRPENLDA